MRRNSSIVRKLIVYFLLLNIFTVIVVGSYSYFRAKDALVERTFGQLTSVRIEKKNRIERFFNDRILDINLVSKTEDVNNIIQLLTKGKVPDDKVNKKVFAEYDKFLRRRFFSGNYYKRFYVAGVGGETVVFNSFDNNISQLYYNRIDSLPVAELFYKIFNSKEIIIDDYKTGTNSNLPEMFMGAPVIDGLNKSIGVVLLEIDIEAINSIMYENNLHNGLGKSGESYLVGSDLLMRSTSRFQDNSIFKTRVNTTGVHKALKGETGTEVIKDYRNISVLSSYSKTDIPGLDWAILAEIDEKEAMVPIESIRNNILYLSVLMSLLLFAFVYIIAKRISLPIVKLKHAAQNITSGNYDVFVEDIVSNDEIGSLVDAFNEMSKKIKEQTQNIMLERSMRLSSMIDGQELERQRLSRELHDGLGQSILAIKMRLERMKNASPEKSEKIMDEVRELFVNTINEIRSISNNLMPAVLNEFGLNDALANLCKDITKSAGIEIKFSLDENISEIDDKTSTYLYRITQEALNNMVKHSNANVARVELNITGSNINLTICDNGIGFSYAENKKLCGNGISNMKERVHLLNGSIDIVSKKGDGTTIKIKIPFKNNDE